MWHRCKACEVLKDQVAHQQSIIASLMAKIGAFPVSDEPSEPEEPKFSQDELEKIDKGEMFAYGGD